MSWRRFCKTSWRCLEDVFARRLEVILKTFWRRLEDVWLRRIYWSWPRRPKDVFWRRKAKTNIFVLIKTSWRRLLKTKTKDVFIKENVAGYYSICFLSSLVRLSLLGVLSNSNNYQISAPAFSKIPFISLFSVFSNFTTLFKIYPETIHRNVALISLKIILCKRKSMPHETVNLILKTIKSTFTIKTTWVTKAILLFIWKLLVIRQKRESQNGCFKKTKHAKFSEKWTFLTLWYAHVRTCAYQGVRNVRFFGKLGVLCFLETLVLTFAFLPY